MENARDKKITLATCNFNTTELTTACILSMLKMSNYKFDKITILDNSNKQKFVLSDRLSKYNIQVLDNTDGKYIDFNKVISNFGKQKSNNNYANLKHTYSILFLLDICQTNIMLLVDSDIILKNSIAGMVPADDVISSFAVGRKYYALTDNCDRYERALPFIQCFNISMMKSKNIQYFDPFRIRHGIGDISIHYDTGASFYEDIIKNNIKFLNITKCSDFIYHLGSGSEKCTPGQKFLEKYKQYWN